MAKRFPLPEFDHNELKGLDRAAPDLLDREAAARIVEAAGEGDASVYGAYPVAASDPFLDSSLCAWRPPSRAPVRHAVGRGRDARTLACLEDPAGGSGGRRGGPPAHLLLDWRTPRPMNTRLGPEEGIASPVAAMYVVLLHRYSDHRVANRTVADNRWKGASGNGFRVLSCDNDESDDFHASVISFDWADG